jgi:hypothetical protein
VTRSAYGLDAGTGTDWKIHGACTQNDPDLWTSPDRVQLGIARWVCLHQCPVLHQCREWAHAHPGLAAGAVYGGEHWVYDRGQGRSRPSGYQPELRLPDHPIRRRPEIRRRAPR